MKMSVQSELIILILSLVQAGFSEGGTRIKMPLKRSYQLPQVAVVNDPQALQYYAGPLYTFPTVLIPSQLSLSAAPIANVVIPPSADPKPAQEFQETSTPVYPSQKPVKIPTQYYKPKHYRPVYGQISKRPTSYVNSVYSLPVRMKPLTSISSHKPKLSSSGSVSIQPSVDLSAQFNQEAESNVYQSTVGPPVASTYGPPKAVDFQYKTRPAGQSAVYHKLKGQPLRHSYYPSKKMRVYSHVHKDHIHNHYIPAGHSFPVYKTPGKYSGPTYLPPAAPTQESSPAYPYQTSSHVRFPEHQESGDHQDDHKPNYSLGDVTQAIIKPNQMINNYDANIPLHVPSKKPYQFEVNEILKNSELHFVQEGQAEKNNEQTNSHYEQKVPYQNGLVLGTQQPLYSTLAVGQPSMLTNPLDIYNLPGVNTYQNNHIVGEQDLGTSETVRVPVAVIRGAHNIAGQGMFGFTVKRQDDTSNPMEKTKKAFTPSKRTSDWIPMSGNGVPLAEKQSDAGQETFAEEYQPPPVRKETKTVRQPVGDIISGKIPEEFSPKGDMVRLLRDSSGGKEKRKGSVIDVYPSSASSDVLNGGDTSDLVVSSVIKFS